MAISQIQSASLASGVPSWANLPTGSVLQVIQATTTGTVTTSGSSYTSAGLTASITPKYATSKILVTVTGADFDSNSGGYQVLGTIFRNGATNLGGGSNASLTDVYTASYRSIFPVILQYLDAPATTSSTSYTLYFYSGSANVVKYNSQSSMGVITLMEIAA